MTALADTAARKHDDAAFSLHVDLAPVLVEALGASTRMPSKHCIYRHFDSMRLCELIVQDCMAISPFNDYASYQCLSSYVRFGILRITSLQISLSTQERRGKPTTFAISIILCTNGL